ncbi:MAG: acetate--CoA ligase family protein [Thermodesulfobacteriota bacterium]
MSESMPGLIPEPEAVKRLAVYSIPYPEHGVAQTAEEAAALADRLGYPVVLKVVSAKAPHKSDVGGVALGLAGPAAVKAEFEALRERIRRAIPGAAIQGVLVCRQAPPGLEVIVGGVDDPVFGPTVMFGLGGIFAEVIKDVSFRIAPLERRDAEEMIGEIKGYPLLRGVRGQEPRDLAKLADLLLAVSRLMIEKPEIKELDLNPVILYPDGLLALDARMVEHPA